MGKTIDIYDYNQLIQVFKEYGIDNILEFVVRNENQRYKEFDKVVLHELTDADSKELKAIKKGLKKLNEIQKTTNITLGKMDNVEANTNQILSSVGKIQGLNEIAIAMQAVNLCATVVGFVIINSKLNDMSEKIDNIVKTIKQVNDDQMNYQFENVVLLHNNLLDKLRYNEEIDLDEYLKLVNAEYSVLNYFYKSFMNDSINDKQTALFTIMSLVSMLSCSICYYDEAYYFEKKDQMKGKLIWHGSHNTWMHIFDELDSDKFKQKLEDYAFLDNGLSQYYMDAFVIAAKDTVKQAKQKILDKDQLLDTLKTRENYDKYLEIVDDLFNKNMNQALSELTETEQLLVKERFESAKATLAV